MIKAVVFDLDDTLMMTRKTRYAALKHAGKSLYGIQILDETIDKHWGKPFLVFLEEVFGEVESPEQIAEKYKKITTQFENKLYDDVIPTIQKLHVVYKLGVVSSASRHLVEQDMDKAGLDRNLFEKIQGSEDTQYHKPDPRVFEPMIEAMGKFDIRPSDMVYVGDMISDFEAADKAGLEFVGIAGRSVDKSVFDELGARSVSSLLDLPELVEKQ